MGQFKPMVKMETTEPSVVLKLKRGGTASRERFEKMVKKADGGAMEMMAGSPPPTTPMGNPAAARAMAARRMMKRPPPMGPMAQTGKPPGPPPAPMGGPGAPMGGPGAPMGRPPMMKKGGKVEDVAQDKAMIKKAFKQHDMQEHKGSKGTTLKLKKGGDAMCEGGMPKGKYATGGVVKGNAGGFATGGVAKGNAGGFATGGVAKGNAGGFKRGGSPAKKYARGGAVQDDGAATKMPQGRKAPSAPVAISRLSGTFKRGGEVC